MTTNPFLSFAARYYNDPVAFVENVLHKKPYHNQIKLLNDIADPERRLISVRSGHSTGKSTTCAFATVWWACTRHDWKIVLTAPTSGQLWDALWPETVSMFEILPPALRGLFKITTDRIQLVSKKKVFVTARTSSKENPESIAGIHSDNTLIFCDEASGIPDPVFETGQGSMADMCACTVLTSNPTRTSGFFYDTHHALSDLWHTHHWSTQDSPFASKSFVEQIRRTYGEGSSQWRVRIEGDFPESDDDALISRARVEAAMSRDIELDPRATKVWCLDPAHKGVDRTAFAEWLGNSVHYVESKSGKDTMWITGWIKNKWDELQEMDRPEEIMVDSIGIGAGIAERLLEMGLPVTQVNVSENALAFSDGAKLRDQLWLEMKRWLESGLGKLPKNEMLLDDLISPEYDFLSNGRTQVESKKRMRQRLGRSPDMADAVIMKFASEPAIIMGQAGRSTWKKPLRRNLVGYG